MSSVSWYVGAMNLTLSTLVPALLMLPAVRDYERPVRQPLPRNEKIATVIATAALETDDPVTFAAWLDVLGAHETAYNPAAVGDSGKSCGAWQTPCDRTPGFRVCTDAEADDAKLCTKGRHFTPTRTVALEQARVAVSVLKTSRVYCAEHPIWMYASGSCLRSRTAVLYEEDVEAELAALRAMP